MGSRGGLRRTRGSPPRCPSQEGLAAQRGWRGAVRRELLQLQSIVLLKFLSFLGDPHAKSAWGRDRKPRHSRAAQDDCHRCICSRTPRARPKLGQGCLAALLFSSATACSSLALHVCRPVSHAVKQRRLLTLGFCKR